MAATYAALGRCVGDEASFAEHNWGRRPLLHRRSGAGFDDLLSLGDVDHLITGTLLCLPAVRLVKDGKPLPPPSYTRTIRVGSRRVPETIRPERVLQAFAGGATIVLQVLHRQWTPIARFCRQLELAMTHPVQANAYVTPAASRGFGVHHDSHDVFVLQTHGRKAWRVFSPGDPGSPVLEAQLEPGDALYIPRGFPHEAEALQGVSVHVTIGILARTWLDVWRHVMNEAADDATFRENLPIGFARDAEALAAEMAVRVGEFQSWFEKAAGGDSATSFAQDYWKRRRPVLDGQLLQVAGLGEIRPSTPLRHRPGSIFHVAVDGQEAIVLLGNRELRMPAFVEPALRYIARSKEGFTAAELSDLDAESSLVLVRRLILEGALEAPGQR